MKLSPSHASPKMPITATTPARSVAVFGTSSTFTLVTSSMMAATDIMTISMTIGMPMAALAPGSLRSSGKKPKTTTAATPTRNRNADGFAEAFSGSRSRSGFGAGISPAFSRA